MDIVGIKYTAPFFDGSGYAEAARQYVLALHKLGIPLTLEAVSFEPARPDLGETGKLMLSLIDKNIPYNIKIIHLTPEHYEEYREGSPVFNIGYVFCNVRQNSILAATQAGCADYFISFVLNQFYIWKNFSFERKLFVF